jgi:hypothetical protein
MEMEVVLHTIRRVVTFNAMVGVTCVLLILIHSWVLARILWRVEASAERIAEMVRDLPQR